MRSTFIRVVAGLGLATTLLLGAPRDAAAHARYDHSDPAAESVVPTAPAQLQAWFTEGVRNQGSSLQVTDTAGNRVDNNDGQVDLNDPDRKRMWVTLQALPDGVYTVRWVTVSADDGDQAEGTFRFGVGANTVLPPQGASAPSPRLTIESASVNGREVRLRVRADGATIALPSGGMDMAASTNSASMAMPANSLPEAHIHVYVDGRMALMLYQPDVVLADVPSGTHDVRVELSNNAHQDWDPPVVTTTTVVVP